MITLGWIDQGMASNWTCFIHISLHRDIKINPYGLPLKERMTLYLMLTKEKKADLQNSDSAWPSLQIPVSGWTALDSRHQQLLSAHQHTQTLRTAAAGFGLVVVSRRRKLCFLPACPSLWPANSCNPLLRGVLEVSSSGFPCRLKSCSSLGILQSPSTRMGLLDFQPHGPCSRQLVGSQHLHCETAIGGYLDHEPLASLINPFLIHKLFL